MPGMPRKKGKITKIAYAVLGKPANLLDDKTKKDSRINRRLIFEETSRVR